MWSCLCLYCWLLTSSLTGFSISLIHCFGMWATTGSSSLTRYLRIPGPSFLIHSLLSFHPIRLLSSHPRIWSWSCPLLLKIDPECQVFLRQSLYPLLRLLQKLIKLDSWQSSMNVSRDFRDPEKYLVQISSSFAFKIQVRSVFLSHNIAMII